MSRVLLLLFILFSSLFAADEIEQFPFIGVTVSTHTIDIHSRDNFSNDEVIAGIRYGQQTLRWRTMFTYEFEQNGYKSFVVEIDRILKDDLFGITKIRPYAGVSLGTISYVNDNLAFDINGTQKDESAQKDKNGEKTSEESESESMDTSGYFYGLNLGLIVYITDNIDMDIGYHYYDVQDFEGMNEIQGLTFSLHYFY